MKYSIEIKDHEQMSPSGISQEDYDALNDAEKAIWDGIGGPGLNYSDVGKYFFRAMIFDGTERCAIQSQNFDAKDVNSRLKALDELLISISRCVYSHEKNLLIKLDDEVKVER